MSPPSLSPCYRWLLPKSLLRAFKLACKECNNHYSSLSKQQLTERNIFCLIHFITHLLHVFNAKQNILFWLITKEMYSHWVLVVLFHLSFPRVLKANYELLLKRNKVNVKISQYPNIIYFKFGRLYFLSKHKRSTQVNNVFDSSYDVATS